MSDKEMAYAIGITIMSEYKCILCDRLIDDSEIEVYENNSTTVCAACWNELNWKE